MHNKPELKFVQVFLYSFTDYSLDNLCFFGLSGFFADDSGDNPCDNADNQGGQSGSQQFITDTVVDGVLKLEFRGRILVGDAGFDDQVIGTEQEDNDPGDDETAGKVFQ